MLTIEESCFQNAKACPDKTAIVSGKKSVTYRELALAILAARKIYTALPNYKRGRAVVIAASKQPSFASAYFGAHLAGLIVVPIDPETNSTRFNHIMKIADPICAVGYKSECSSLLSLSLKSFDCFDAVDCEWNICYPKPDDVADIMFTTGTTGAPKGVVLTYANEAAAVRNINEYIGNLPEDVELLALPISHSFGLGRMRCCLANGQTLILQGSFANVKRLFRIMDEQSVTGFSMVPASWRFLQKMSGDKLSEYASQLRYVEMGSAYFRQKTKDIWLRSCHGPELLCTMD